MQGNKLTKGKSDKIMGMPDGRSTQATTIVKLPYPTLSDKACEAHDLPTLHQNSLLSVPVLADEGYSTIFHPFQEGVDAYKKGNVTIQAASPPGLQGCKEISGLWTVDGKHEKSMKEATANTELQQHQYVALANNVYN